ncbi:RagB/SusD domain-containing protein [Gemmatirosa kalamazoonensis]|uniref:RagB/SusD domain-containing protein n=1 Tax=Gemmatirosa kalamazoonensis TaxID=861299 RepID=W0RGA4_9BACT|nr:hypothetical protein [Gemmatirosa kalamazoonensis]AHG89360.1 RagB/SusD domain-containing protein [Gemmatirosa kalamazoonensis]
MRNTYRALGAAALALGTACNTDSLLRVTDQDVVRPTAVSDSTSLPVFLAGAQSDFQTAFSGTGLGNEGQANIAGLFTDEFIQTESFASRFDVDRRQVQSENGTMAGIFLDLSRARAAAERASAQYVKFNQPNASGRIDALTLAGFSYTLFGENYCSGVPFSTLDENNQITYGQPQTTSQMFGSAIAKFDSALAIPGISADQRALAQVGRGRALLDLGRFDDAAAAVASVPIGFQWIIESSSNSARQYNGVWELTANEGRWGVADREGGNGLDFVTAEDPRVPFDAGALGFDNGPSPLQLKYPDRSSLTVLADGIEAKLIVAEAQLRRGDRAGMTATLNALRADPTAREQRVPADLPTGFEQDFSALVPLAVPATQDAARDLLFRERAFWLFGTSHRLGDMRRLVRQYARPASSVFPSGNYLSNGRTGTYGTDVNLPIPIDEGNNPNTPRTGERIPNKGCIDRNA